MHNIFSNRTNNKKYKKKTTKNDKKHTRQTTWFGLKNLAILKYLSNEK